MNGRIEGKTHIFPICIGYEDTDCGGVVYHANYVSFSERARSALLRLLGIGVVELAKGGENIAMAVVEVNMRFLAPACLEDVIEVHTILEKLKGTSLYAYQEIKRGEKVLWRANTRIVCVTPELGPRRFPEKMTKALAPLLP